MSEKQMQRLIKCNDRQLGQQFENEDIAKELLLLAKERTDFEISERQKFLNKRIENRKNLYIYPAKSNCID